MWREGMNKRVEALRLKSLTTKPSIDMERALLITEAYQLYEDKVSSVMLRALAFKHLMTHKKLYYGDGELIIGERGPKPAATPTYPELCCHSIDDFMVIKNRSHVQFQISQEAFEVQNNVIIPFWKGKSLRDQILKAMSPSWHACYEAGLFTEFMEQRAPGHAVAGQKLFKYGVKDYKKQIKDKLKAQANTLTADQKDQLQAMLVTLEGLLILGDRYKTMIEAMLSEAKDPIQQETLTRILETLQNIPQKAPQNTHEALQMYWFVHIGIISELNTWDAFSPGRLDQHLWPFVQKDLDRGVREDVIKELLACLWVKFNNQPAPPKVGITLLESSTYTDFANIGLGGLTPDGKDGVNPLSYMILDVIDEMALLQPSSNVQISEQTPDAFIDHALKVLGSGRGQPSIFNADGVVKQLTRQGKTLEDARQGGTSGCVETGAFGKESAILTGYFNLPKILELVMTNGYDNYSKKKVGLQTGAVTGIADYDSLLLAYRVQLQHILHIKMVGNDQIERLIAHKMPAPFMSLMIEGCIENARDYNRGGAKYHSRYVQGVGLGSVTDMLAAIKHHVFDEKRVTLHEIKEAMVKDFAGEVSLLSLLRDKSPKYGNHEALADACMRDVFDAFFESVDGRQSICGGTYRINLLPTTCHVYFGHVMLASPDGRRAKMPLSEGVSPVQGMDKTGPTHVLLSASKIPQDLTGGTLLNQKFTPEFYKSDKARLGIRGLIRTYFKLGGHHMQFNVVDKETLLKAQIHPRDYDDLIVRVAGYSDKFNYLSPILQNEIIARTSHQSLSS